jgi:ABC-2 type transport system permease protein
MTAQSNAMPQPPLDPEFIAPASLSPTRPFYWSVRRELWENRSIYIVPLAAAAVMLFGFLISTLALPDRMRSLSALDPAAQSDAFAEPYDFAAILLILTSIIVGVFYSLGALHGERRDRSILFWKSLPVSDLTTVLAKASIPLVLLPLLAFAIAVATQLIMLLSSTAILLLNGQSAAMLWARLPLLQMQSVLLYGLVVIGLWLAPIYGWLLLVSAWARRALFLWAVLPPLALSVVEKIAFDTSHVASMLIYRLTGWFDEAFTGEMTDGLVVDRLSQLHPVRFLGSPGLWIGLGVAAVFLAAAVWLRRRREPI